MDDNLFEMDYERQCQLGDQLHEAVRNNDTATAERILQDCVALEGSIPRYIMAKCCKTALKNRCLPMVKLLLSQNNIPYYFNTMMWVAVESDFTEGVEFLQSKGRLLDKDCIYKCLKNNKPGVLKYILEHEILLLSEPTVYSTPTSNKQLKHVETCALHYCIRGRELDKVRDCVQLLVEAGADINMSDKYGKTPIKLAAEHDMVTTVTYLAQRGANLDIKQHHNNLLHCLAGRDGSFYLPWLARDRSKVESDSYDECLQLLITRGVDINQLNSSNKTPLYIAVENSNKGMVKSLITANCDVNIKVGDDLQPILLMSILRREETTIPEILIKAGCDINGTDENGVTPLMECLKYRRVDLTKLLIENGSDLNAQDNKGRCVLEYLFDGFIFFLSQCFIRYCSDVARCWC